MLLNNPTNKALTFVFVSNQLGAVFLLLQILNKIYGYQRTKASNKKHKTIKIGVIIIKIVKLWSKIK